MNEEILVLTPITVSFNTLNPIISENTPDKSKRIEIAYNIRNVSTKLKIKTYLLSLFRNLLISEISASKPYISSPQSHYRFINIGFSRLIIFPIQKVTII